MKKLNIMKKIGLAGMLGMFSSLAFADDSSISNLGDFQGIISGQAATIMQIVMIIATLAGIILIIKGLVHLKQNYTGSGQEKHLSKGIASLVFGVLLVLAIPISHMLVGSLDKGSAAQFNTQVTNVSFS